MMGAGVIHVAAVRSHLGSAPAVASFIGVGAAQILLGGSWLLSGDTRAKRISVSAVGAGAVLAWLISRIWGLPAISGHIGAERVGAGDLAAAALQLVALLLILRPGTFSPAAARTRFAGVAMALPIVAVSAVASASLLAVPQHSHEPTTSVAAVRTSGSSVTPALVKRAVPRPISTPAPADHVDAPGAPSHSH